MTTFSLRCLTALLLAATTGLGMAQALRDPTVPPAAAGLPAATAAPLGAADLSGTAAIVVRNGKAHLVVGTRLYAQGQRLGQARIERITETEVWLREGGVLRKVPLFAGIQRSAARTP